MTIKYLGDGLVWYGLLTWWSPAESPRRAVLRPPAAVVVRLRLDARDVTWS